jgi:hypothetical protein
MNQRKLGAGLFSFILVAIFCGNLEASTRSYMAEVLAIKGSVQQVWGKETRRLDVGDKLYVGDQIDLSEKSSIRFLLVDNNSITLDQNTSVTLQAAPSEESKAAGVILLRRGLLRGEVEGDGGEKSVRLYIATKNASFAIRGTEFLTHYNSQLMMTSHITLSGLVAGIYEERPRLEAVTEELLLGEFKKNIVTLIPPGQFVHTVGVYRFLSYPIRLSPAQSFALSQQKARLFQREKSPATLNDEKSMKKTDVLALSVPQVAPAEGQWDVAQLSFASKNGGLWDHETGLYFPPSADTPFSHELGTFARDMNRGTFAADDGTYLAPTGIKTDSRAGVKRIAEGPLSDVQLAEWQRDIHLELHDTLHSGSVQGAQNKRYLSEREMYIKDYFWLRYSLGKRKMTIKGSTSEQDLKTDTLARFNWRWMHSTHARWRPYTDIEYEKVDFTGATRFTQESRSHFALKAGVRWSMSPVFSLVSDVRLKQFALGEVRQTTPMAGVIEKFAMVHLALGVGWQYPRTSRLQYQGDLLFQTNLSKRRLNSEVAGGFGLRSEHDLTFWLNQRWFSTLSFGLEWWRAKVRAQVGTVQAYDYEMSLFEWSVGPKLGFVF